MITHLEECDWISTNGGPLLIISSSLVPLWRGNETTRDHNLKTDYDRACQVSGYIGTVDVAHGQAVVCGEQPFMSTWWHESASEGMIVRWVCADGEDDITSLLSNKDVIDWEDDFTIFNNFSDSIHIMDSSRSGFDTEDKLVVLLNRGIYKIETCLLNLNPRLEFILHRFSLQQPS